MQCTFHFTKALEMEVIRIPLMGYTVSLNFLNLPANFAYVHVWVFFLGTKFNIFMTQLWIDIPKTLKPARGTGPRGHWVFTWWSDEVRGVDTFVHPPVFSKEARHNLSEMRSLSSLISQSSPLPSHGGLSDAHQVPSPLWPRCFCSGHSHRGLHATTNHRSP